QPICPAHEAPMPARKAPALDAIDIRILAALQRDGRMTIKRLAEIVGLSARPCLERVRRLEVAGIIAGYQAQVAVERLSKPVVVFAEIWLERHAGRDAVEKRLKATDEAVESWEISGASDYLVRFVCADLVRYEELTAELLGDAALGISRIVSHIVLRPVRRFAGFPTALLKLRRD
ncbi:MAG TPA: Lrp/AsnC family transcriptional regulator, partial [Alphaproteobacteria bacterium]|nr:Lrp/AsnC family transcriptional regulator [Alphaproteobacteria bacterium]